MTDYAEIIPGLTMGGESIIPVPPAGFDAYLSLREFPDVTFPPGNLLTQEGPVFVQVPMLDIPILPPEHKIMTACLVIGYMMNQQKTTYCHCKAGHNRSGLVVATFLVKHWNYKPRDAIYLIRSKRGVDALSNMVFVDYILGLK